MKNVPYSVTDYSFVPVRVRDESASVDALFTVTNASGVERLERTQEFVCERGGLAGGDAARTGRGFPAEEDGTEDEADTGSTRDPVAKTGDLDCDDFDYQEDA